MKAVVMMAPVKLEPPVPPMVAVAPSPMVMMPPPVPVAMAYLKHLPFGETAVEAGRLREQARADIRRCRTERKDEACK